MESPLLSLKFTDAFSLLLHRHPYLLLRTVLLLGCKWVQLVVDNQLGVGVPEGNFLSALSIL